MLKNKFNIGQKVIIVNDSKIIEKEVKIIKKVDGVLCYGFETDDVTISFPPAWPTGRSRHGYMIGVDPYRSVELFKQEDEIFESEADFRKSAKIEFIKPSKKDLKQQLKDYKTDDAKLKSLIEKIV